MSKADDQIREILAAHGEDFLANTWVVPGGKARAIHHHCTERMAAKDGIKFSMPEIISADQNNVVIVVKGTAKSGEEAWSFGEASPKNNKNSYPFSMAEKRAKDRVALKLLKLHGLVYSEAEADEFRNGNSEATTEDAPKSAAAPAPAPKPIAKHPPPKTAIDEIMEGPTESQERIYKEAIAAVVREKTLAGLNAVVALHKGAVKDCTDEQWNSFSQLVKTRRASFEAFPGEQQAEILERAGALI